MSDKHPALRTSIYNHMQQQTHLLPNISILSIKSLQAQYILYQA